MAEFTMLAVAKLVVCMLAVGCMLAVCCMLSLGTKLAVLEKLMLVPVPAVAARLLTLPAVPAASDCKLPKKLAGVVPDFAAARSNPTKGAPPAG